MKHTPLYITFIAFATITNNAYSEPTLEDQAIPDKDSKHLVGETYKPGSILVKFIPEVYASEEKMVNNQSVKRLSKYGKYSTSRITRLTANKSGSRSQDNIELDQWVSITLPPGLTATDAILLFQNDTEVQAVKPGHKTLTDNTPDDPGHIQQSKSNDTEEANNALEADTNTLDISAENDLDFTTASDTDNYFTQEFLADDMQRKPGKPPKKDLLISNLSAPRKAGLDGQFTVKFSVYNQGEFNIDEENLWSVRLYADTDMMTNYIDLEWGSISFNERGEHIYVTATVNIPGGISVGEYHIGAITGPLLDTARIEKISDVVTSPIEIIEYDSDASITDITFSSTSLLKGSTISLSTTIENSGSNNIDNISADIYLSIDSVIDETDTKLGAISTTLGGNNDATLSFDAKLNVAPGNYYVGVIADPGNTVSETDEGNNIRIGELIKIEPNADLSLTDMTTATE